MVWAEFADPFCQKGLDLGRNWYASSRFQAPLNSPYLSDIGDDEPAVEVWFGAIVAPRINQIFGRNSYHKTSDEKTKTIPDKFIRTAPLDLKVNRKLPDNLVRCYNEGVVQIEENEAKKNEAKKNEVNKEETKEKRKRKRDSEVPREQTQAYWIIRQIYTYVVESQPTSFGIISSCDKTFFVFVQGTEIRVSPCVYWNKLVFSLKTTRVCTR